MLSAYDAWVTREPDWFTDPPPQPKCGKCGSYIAWEPASEELNKHVAHCNGKAYDDMAQCYNADEGEAAGGYPFSDHAPHDCVFYEGMLVHRPCKRCGHDNVQVEV